MRNIIKTSLIELGFSNFIEASDGLKAIEILEQQLAKDEPIEFIISDWNMPHMLGIDLLRHCSKSLEFTNIPFILVTTECGHEQIMEAVKAGVSDYVIKPFSFGKIKEKIEKVYNKHHPFFKVS